MPSPRRGSIEPGSGYGFTEATTLGQEVHKIVQQQRKGDYEHYSSEVKVSHKFEHRGHTILVTGRIDGLFNQAVACKTLEQSVSPPARSENVDQDITTDDETETQDSPSESTYTQKGPTLDHHRDNSDAERESDPADIRSRISAGKPVLHALANTSSNRAVSSEQGLGNSGPLGAIASPAIRASSPTPNTVSQLNLFRASLPAETVSRSADRPHIEEIKTAFSAAKLAQKVRLDPWHPYCLQVKTYAYIQFKQTGMMPTASLYLVSLLRRDAIEVEIDLDIRSYEDWLARRLDEVVEEAERQESEYQRRKTLAHKLKLPFEKARPGQEELIDQLEKGIANGRPILVQAPTGLGKTMAVMLPTLRDAFFRGQKLIYTTPKNSIHKIAEDAAERLRSCDVPIKSLTLTAKAKMCKLSEVNCDPKVCEYARDYYTKLSDNAIVEEVTSSHADLTPTLFSDYGEKYKVCPFELSLDCIDRADIVICDYNHVFAPISLSGRLTNPTHRKNAKPNLVIDEAHNLHTRATGYFSAEVQTRELEELRSMIHAPEAKLLASSCIELVRTISITQRTPQAKVQLDTDLFMQVHKQLTRLVMESVDTTAPLEQSHPLMQLYYLWSEFCSALEHNASEKFCTCKREKNNITIKITCCDASKALKQRYQEYDSVVAFSATLKPFSYFSTLSGFDNDSTQVFEAASPFPRSNKKIIVIPQISTKWTDRAANYQKICDVISRITALKPANYIVFFPSFDFLEEVASRLSVPNFQLIMQKRSMSNSEVQLILQEMRTNRSCILMAVQGGTFSEGVDFAGEMASGAIIVGPGLPGYDLERELLREYYERTYGSGFEYAYTYPAMTKVIQSAGRVVRSETDRSLIVLLDRRFLADSYAQSMPVDWYAQNPNELVSNSILKDVETFWQNESTIDALVDAHQNTAATAVCGELSHPHHHNLDSISNS